MITKFSKYLISITVIVCVLSSTVNAGFWSSALGTAAGSSGGSNKNYYYEKDAKKEPKRIQQTLSKLGFYIGGFDGNLNSFDTRSAIEEFQAYYNIKDDGILDEIQKQDVLYMHDLIKNYKKELQHPKNKDSKRLKRLYKAFDKLEIKLSKGNFSKQFMSLKFKDEIKNRREYVKKEETKHIAEEKKTKELQIKAREEKRKKRIAEEKRTKELQVKVRKAKLLRWKKNGGIVTDTKLGLIWQDNVASKSTKKKWKSAKQYCKNLSFKGYSDWRLPSYSELLTIVDYGNNPVIMPSFEHVKNDYYWTSSTTYEYYGGYANVVLFKNGYKRSFTNTYYELNVRCVRGKQ